MPKIDLGEADPSNMTLAALRKFIATSPAYENDEMILQAALLAETVTLRGKKIILKGKGATLSVTKTTVELSATGSANKFLDNLFDPAYPQAMEASDYDMIRLFVRIQKAGSVLI